MCQAISGPSLHFLRLYSFDIVTLGFKNGYRLSRLIPNPRSSIPSVRSLVKVNINLPLVDKIISRKMFFPRYASPRSAEELETVLQCVWLSLNGRVDSKLDFFQEIYAGGLEHVVNTRLQPIKLAYPQPHFMQTRSRHVSWSQ